MTRDEIYLWIKGWEKKVGIVDKDIADKLGCSQQNISNKLVKGSIRLVDFENILNLYGYHLKIVKKPKE